MMDSPLPTISPNESKIRATKRKLDDAFQILDNAVSPPAVDRPSPLKRTNNTIRSFYSTLAKYGIKSGSNKKQTTSSHVIKNTPRLAAILSRAASKTKNTFNFKFPPPTQAPAASLAPSAEYRPSSLPSFLSRLGTFKLATYGSKPPSIDAVAAARCGWTNDGKDRLVCGLCNASWVVAGREGLNRDAANALVEKQRTSLVEAHKNGCPWKTRQCDDAIYCISLHSPSTMIRDIKTNAIAMSPVMKDISIKHPLTSTQFTLLLSTVKSYKPSNYNVDNQLPCSDADDHNCEPSETAVLSSLFGWSLVKSPPPEMLRRSSTTRASSVVPSIPDSPASSRAPSVSLSRTPQKISESIASSLCNLEAKADKALLQCEFCQRRIGLWTFSSRSSSEDVFATTTTNAGNPHETSTPARPVKPLPRRSLDLLKEHRSYCPYVVRSTFVPSLPVPLQTLGTPVKSNGNASTTSLAHHGSSHRQGAQGALEGWRAVLTVVLRYGMAQKQRIEYNFLVPRDPTNESEDMDVDNVKAMVSGVKARGGKDLLKYVKGLLG